MKGSVNKIVALVLGLFVVGLVAALMSETGQNPVFRTTDYANYQECVLNIPAEWLRGSIEWERAESGCRFDHPPVRPAGP